MGRGIVDLDSISQILVDESGIVGLIIGGIVQPDPVVMAVDVIQILLILLILWNRRILRGIVSLSRDHQEESHDHQGGQTPQIQSSHSFFTVEDGEEEENP